jgi:CRISPR-associated protein Cas2
MNRLWVISYDISEDRQRLAVERELLKVGDRVQYSVFECYLHRSQVPLLAERLAALIAPGTDSLRFYPLCTWCQERISWHGRGLVPDDPACYII